MLWGDGVKQWSSNGCLKVAEWSTKSRPRAHSLFEHVFIIHVLRSIPVDGKSRCEDAATRSMDDHLRMTSWHKGMNLYHTRGLNFHHTEYEQHARTHKHTRTHTHVTYSLFVCVSIKNASPENKRGVKRGASLKGMSLSMYMYKYL